MKYRPEIDGLRALAVIPVIFFHAGFKGFSGGFIGVDIFFVISGYLITTIILEELEQGNFSIINFYERRTRRILPALFLVMFICIPFAWLWLLPSDLKVFSQSLVAVSSFASNIFFWRKSGYFDEIAELNPLLHTWSLAVEEQFYLVFPLLLLIFWRFGKVRLLQLLGLIFVCSLALAQWGAQTLPVPSFFLLPTRGWELLIGAFAAFYSSSTKRTDFDNGLSEIAGWLGVILIFYAAIFYSSSTPYPGFYALVPTIGTVLIILFTTERTLVGKLLGNKVFVQLGLLSYSAYLWHQPLFAFARHRSLLTHYQNQIMFVVLAILSFVLAYFSWRFVETPFRNKAKFSRSQIFIYASIGLSIFITVGLIGHLSSGVFIFRKNTNDIMNLDTRLAVNRGLSQYCVADYTESPKCMTSDSPEVMVWGDSYAMHLVQGLQASNPKITLVQKTVSVCGPFLDIAPINAKYVRNWAEKCIAINDKVFDYLKNTPSIKYVVMSSPFTQYVGVEAKVMRRDGDIVPGKKVSVDAMIETIRRIKELGITPVIFSPPPRNGEDIGGCLKKTTFFDKDRAFCDVLVKHSTQIYAEVWGLLKEVEKVATVVWLSDFLCSDKSCKSHFGEILIYRDAGHLSYEGSAFLGKQMNFYGRLVEAGIKEQR